MRRRGASLAMVLVVVTLSLIAVFSLAATTVHNLRAGMHHDRALRARYLAESAVAEGIAELIQDRAWHEPVDLRPAPGERGHLTFASNAPGFSTNNADGLTPVEGFDDHVVPNHSVQLIGHGECQGTLRSMRVLIHFPRFSAAVASSGPVHADGGLLVAAVDPTSTRSVDDLKPDDYLPAHVTSNSRTDQAVYLGKGSEVSGDVRASGGITVDPGTVVRGSVQPGLTDTAALPRVDYNQFDPVSLGTGHSDLPGTSPELTGLTGMNRRSGNLVVAGDVELNGGVLFVDGNVTIRGALRGQGALIVTGSTTVEGAVDVDGEHSVALLSRGDVSLQGVGGARFQGLVYSEGNFNARDMTLVGTLVANGQDQDGSRLGLSNVRIYESVRHGAPRFEVVTPPPPPPPSLGYIEYGMHPGDQGLFSHCPLPAPGPLLRLAQEPNSGRLVVLAAIGPTQHHVVYDGFDHAAGLDALWEYCGQNLDPDLEGVDLVSKSEYVSPPRRLPNFGNRRTPGPNPIRPPGQPGTPGSPSPSSIELDFNLSRFLQPQDQMELILWTEL